MSVTNHDVHVQIEQGFLEDEHNQLDYDNLVSRYTQDYTIYLCSLPFFKKMSVEQFHERPFIHSNIFKVIDCL